MPLFSLIVHNRVLMIYVGEGTFVVIVSKVDKAICLPALCVFCFSSFMMEGMIVNE